MFSKLFFTRHFRKLTYAGVLLAGQMYYNGFMRNKYTHCCGIVGFIGKFPNASKFILNGVELLQNRDYDSAGICTLNSKKEIIQTKFASDILTNTDCIKKLIKMAPTRHVGHFIGLGHTRWATCGEKSDINAHPHNDYVLLYYLIVILLQKNRISLVHNGTLYNIAELRKEIQEKGIKLRSQTDTELIAQIIGIYLDEGLGFFDAVKKTLEEKIQGTWGLVIMHKDHPKKLIACKNGSPLLIGISDSGIFIASEYVAFQKHTSNYIYMEDGEIVVLDLEHRKTFYQNYKERVNQIKQQNIKSKPTPPFKTFLEQEIMEQPQSLLQALNFGARLGGIKGCPKLGGLEQHASEICGIENCVILACGTSKNASLFCLRIFKKLKCFNTIQVFEASDFVEDDFPLENCGVIMVSQSGETYDLIQMLKMTEKLGLFTLGIVNTVGSTVSRLTNCGVFCNSGREVSVAATKTFTSQIVCMSLVALWVSHNKGKTQQIQARINIIELLHKLPTVIGQCLFSVRKKIKKIADCFLKCESLYILGKGQGTAIAFEGALKIKEITYIHAEGLSSGALKHGPLALIDSATMNSSKVILIILNDEYLKDNQTTLSEVKSRNGFTFVITDCYEKLKKENIDEYVEIQSLGIFTGVLAVLPFQLLTLYIAEKKGHNPDKPRNLAKCVTVN